MKITIKHTCGHKSRVEVGNGPAREKSARAFDASLENCPNCRQMLRIADEEPAIHELLEDLGMLRSN